MYMLGSILQVQYPAQAQTPAHYCFPSLTIQKNSHNNICTKCPIFKGTKLVRKIGSKSEGSTHLYINITELYSKTQAQVS